MTGRDDHPKNPVPDADPGSGPWAQQWALVPDEWRRPVYRIHLPPYDQPDAESVVAQYDRVLDALTDKLPAVAEPVSYTHLTLPTKRIV